MKKVKGSKGITLVALVITVIILLILAGVTIATLAGDNGILTRASESKEKTEKAQEKESLELAVTSSRMGDVNTLEIEKENLENAIKQQFGNNKDFSVTDNKDGSFLVNMNDTKRMYYVDNTGLVIAEENILKISTIDELKAFRDDVNSGNTYEGWYVYLESNITLDDSEEWKPIGLYLMENSSPNKETNKPFSGVFDGRNHEINGIYINTSDKAQGLFGLVNNGKILNLGIGSNNNIVGGSATGGICGYLYNGGIISNCYNKSIIKCSFGGGIVGCSFSNTLVTDCYNTNTITGNDSTGGIAGINNENATIKNCNNNGVIQCTGYHIGGITGQNQNNSNIEKCYNNASVAGLGYCGGIAGSCYYSSIIKLCYNTNYGNVNGVNECIGGIVGKDYSNSTIIDSYNRAQIQTEGNIAGGIIGTIEDAEIYNCYNTGNINGTGNQIGGVIGQQIGEIKINNNYYEENIVNNANDINITGIEVKTSNDMKKLYTVLGINWQEDKRNINNGYPILQWQ